MNILFIAPYTPTLIRVRPYNLIKFLAQRGHHITLATLWESIDEFHALAEWRSIGVEVLAARLTRTRSSFNAVKTLPTRDPLQVAYCDSPELRRLIRNQINAQRFDVVHVEHLRGARYGLQVKSLRDNSSDSPLATRHLPLIWDSVDCISYLFEQAARFRPGLLNHLITWLELGRTKRYEARLAAQFDRVLVTSEIDRDALQALSPRASIEVLPNGVDPEYFSPREDWREPNTIVFSGKMSYHANVAATHYLIDQIMPRVWQRQPAAKLIIAGSRPPKSIRLAAQHDQRLEVTGALADMRTALWRASVSVAPLLYGAGIQNKVLEAFACGLPVVASARALAALPLAKSAALIADEPQAFADSVLDILKDAALRARLSAAGRAYVEHEHAWQTVAQHLEDIYRAVRVK
jgi:glycosyltransferase involved in cell wall biosynthesis